MCGIVGFTGKRQAAPILLDGLSKLEYRGYDSAGIAVRDGDTQTEIIKEKGKLKVLADKNDNGRTVKGCCGIGHTIWATHGEPSTTNSFFIGRGSDYAIGMEGSLKLKEISYIHSEAYAAGELKHGPISLIEDGTIVISVVTQDKLVEKTISNMAEVKSRGAKVMAVTTAGNYNLA